MILVIQIQYEKEEHDLNNFIVEKVKKCVCIFRRIVEWSSFTDACTCCPWTSSYDLHLNLIVEYPESACKAAWDWRSDLFEGVTVNI